MCIISVVSAKQLRIEAGYLVMIGSMTFWVREI